MLDSQKFSKTISDQEIAFYQSLKNNSNFDFILFTQKIDHNLAEFEYLPAGDLLKNKNLNYYLKAVEAIAKFHYHTQNLKLNIPIDLNYYSSSLKLNFSLPPEQLAILESSLDYINSHLQLIHDDFLPQNVLVDGENIKIIDWENLRYGFAEHDLGRFLGDLDNNLPHFDKKYYPSKWYPLLKQRYLQTRKSLDQNYDLSLGENLIVIGEMWNHLGPIEMCLKQNDSTSVWFTENLKALSNLKPKSLLE